MTPPPRIAGRYRLESILGEGGCATVWRAMDEHLNRACAVKLLRTTGLHRHALRDRLHAEARAMTRLAHPNVLRVYDVIEDVGQDCIVMELVPNGSLGDHLDERGPLSARDALERTREVLFALEAAHAAGVVHRDVKPQNILIGEPRRALLADFGVALVEQADQRHTRTGAALGSFSFMAPEQRIDARTVGPTADIYGVAATLYALLTNGNPIDLFTAEPDSQRLSMLPEPLRELVLRGTRFLPEERYPTAKDMRHAVEQALERSSDSPLIPKLGPPPGAHAPTMTDTVEVPAALPAPRSTRPWLVLLLGLALIWAWPRPVVAPAPSPVTSTPFPPPVDEPPSETPIALPSPAASSPPLARPKPAPRTDDPSLVTGIWEGTWNGRPVTLTLHGAAPSLHGTLDVSFLSNTVRSQVRGSFDPKSGTLRLRDVLDTSDSGTYRAAVDPDSSRLAGTFTGRHNGRVIQFAMRHP